MLAVEICYTCYYVDNKLETVIGNAICADGAAAFHSARISSKTLCTFAVLTATPLLLPSRSNRWDFNYRNGKLRTVLGASIQHLSLIERALDPLRQRRALSRSQIRFLGCSPWWT
jgi:predicted naringenin-chalcone synthase